MMVAKLDPNGHAVSEADFAGDTLPNDDHQTTVMLGFSGNISALAWLADGGIGVAGTAYNSRFTSCGAHACGSGNSDAFIARVGADGAIAKSARIGGEHFQVLTTLTDAAACADGGFVAGGTVGKWNLPSDGPDPVTEVERKPHAMRASASGDVTWMRRYMTAGASDTGSLLGLVSDGGDGAVIRASMGALDVLMQIDGSGNPVW